MVREYKGLRTKPCIVCGEVMEYRNCMKVRCTDCQLDYVNTKRRRRTNVVDPDEVRPVIKSGRDILVEKFRARRTEAEWAEVQAIAGEAV